MRRPAAWVLVPVLLLGAGCRDDATPPRPDVDQQVDEIESTLDAIESEMAGE